MRAVIGGVGICGLLASQREQERKQKPVTVTKRLIPFTWASLDPTEPYIIHETHKPSELQKSGLEFSINGSEFLALFDSGSMPNTIMLDKQTAELLDIDHIARKSKSGRIEFPGTPLFSVPTYLDVSLTLPGVETVITKVMIGGNNLINP
jgi:hypothetical protein